MFSFNFQIIKVSEDLKEKYQQIAFSDINEKSEKQFDIAINYKKHSVATKNKRIRRIKAVYNITEESYLYLVEEECTLKLYFMTNDSLKLLETDVAIRRESNIVYFVEELNIYLELDLNTQEITFLSSTNQKKNIVDEYFVDLFEELKQTIKNNKTIEKEIEQEEIEKNLRANKRHTHIFDEQIIGRFRVTQPLRPQSIVKVKTVVLTPVHVVPVVPVHMVCVW